MEWVGFALPKPLADEIRKICGPLGYAKPSAFIQEAVRLHLEKKRWEYERKKQEEEDAVIEKHEKGEESVEHAFDK